MKNYNIYSQKPALTYIRQAADLLKTIDSLTEEEVKRKRLHDWRVLSTLRSYEKWRKGGNNAPPTPKQISWAIEEVIREYKQRFR